MSLSRSRIPPMLRALPVLAAALSIASGCHMSADASEARLRSLTQAVRSTALGWRDPVAALMRIGAPAKDFLNAELAQRPEAVLDVVRDRIATGVQTYVPPWWADRHLAAAESTLAAGQPREAFRRMAAVAYLAPRVFDDRARNIQLAAESAWMAQSLELRLSASPWPSQDQPLDVTASFICRDKHGIEVEVEGDHPVIGVLEVREHLAYADGRRLRSLETRTVEAGSFSLALGESNAVSVPVFEPVKRSSIPFVQTIELSMLVRPSALITWECRFSGYLRSPTLRLWRLPAEASRSMADTVAIKQALAQVLDPESAAEALIKARAIIFYGCVLLASGQRATEVPAVPWALPRGTATESPPPPALAASLARLLRDAIAQCDAKIMATDEKLLRVTLGHVLGLDETPEREAALRGHSPP